MAVRAAEAAVAAGAPRQLLHFLPGDRGNWGHDELRDAVAAADADGGTAEVDEEDLNLAPVVGVDRTRGVEEREAVAVSETAARPDLALVAGRDGEREAGRYEAALSGA